MCSVRTLGAGSGDDVIYGGFLNSLFIVLCSLETQLITDIYFPVKKTARCVITSMLLAWLMAT